jgi:hypothetical protein
MPFHNACPLCGSLAPCSCVLFNAHVDSPDEVTQDILPPKLFGCRRCGKELCAELDAYYGKEPMMEYYCDPCRRKELRALNAMHAEIARSVRP